MSRRKVVLGGWLAFAAALAGLHTAHTTRVFAVAMMVITCGGTALHLVRAIRSHGHARRVWVLAGLGLGCWAYAEVSVGVPALVTGTASGRGLAANLLNLLAPFFAVAAMLIIPAAPRGAAERIRMMLDGVVAAAALSGTAWVLIVGPLIELEGIRRTLFDLAYPVLTIGVLAIAIVLLAGMRWRQAGAMTAITGGVLVAAVTLLVEIGAHVAGLPALRPWIHDGYLTASALLAGSALLPLPRRADREWRPASTAASLLPFLPMAVFMLVCLVTGVSVRQIEPAVTLSGTVAVLALFGRQFLTIRSNVRLTRDLDEQRARFADEARHDPLTGLPNRAVLNRSLARAGDDATLLMIDLDGFKAVNDTLGHTAGDDLLVVIADRLRAAIVPFDALACRLGGDEFAVLCSGLDRAGAAGLADRIGHALAEPMLARGIVVQVGASVGLAVAADCADGDDLLSRSDDAMFAAKRRRRSLSAADGHLKI
jgi:diguanylate cyclase (GGDEF)-like protein